MDRQIARAARRILELPSLLPIHEWGQRHVPLDRTSFKRGKWTWAVTPWVVEPLRAFHDITVRDITVVGPSQGGKSTPSIVAMLWAIANDPGPAAWITGDDTLATKFSKERAGPTVRACKPLAGLFTGDRHDQSTHTMRFTTCTVDVMGAQAASSLESASYRYVFADECRLWPKGSLQKIEKRTLTYPNAKRMKFSTPMESGDEFDASYQASTREEWHFPCMGCGADIHLCPPNAWETLMRWDTNEVTRPGGVWNEDAALKTLRLECPACQHRHQDRPAVRRHMLTAGKYVAMNPGASPRARGFRWNAFLPTWNSWGDIWKSFVGAQAAMKLGNMEPLKIFIREVLAEPFDVERHQVVEPAERPESSYSFADVSAEVFDFKFFTVDVQDKCFWGVVRGWNKDGASKLLWAGEMLTWGEIGEVQAKHGVKSHLVFVDSGDGNATRGIYARCVQFGWTALKGTDKPHFIHVGRKTGRRVQRMYSPRTYGDPHMGTAAQGTRYATLFLWANDPAKDALSRLRAGQGAPWEVPSDIPDFYWNQMDSEMRKSVVNKRTGREEWRWVRVRKANHLWDCEAMQIVAASMAKLLGTVRGDDEPSQEEGR